MNPFTTGVALVRLRFPLQSLLLIVFLATLVFGQSPNGTISGLVLDPASRAIAGAEVLVANDATGIRYPGLTNSEGIYTVANLPPGSYRIQVSKVGFKTLIKPDIVLNVQSAVAINFTLPVGAVSETVTVEGGASGINTESAAVSTVVDRQFAENLPMNGRSFQTLIQLTPGVVVAPSNSYDSGQVSVNGQRTSANYWMVDGVSANIGVGVTSLGNPGNGAAGAIASFSAQGGTNSLVSVDALQEFRIQTSTYAPEFGRTPGGQISIVTRSGANQLHGTLFDYFRNDALDANDWFADRALLSKPQERQNDFGGTLSGRLIKDRTFFFLSYEGLRLRLPQVAQTTVPSLDARQDALPALQPYFDAYPLPVVGAPDTNGTSPFDASFSNSSTLDAYSLRVDDHTTNKLTLFGRYNYSPSEIIQRGFGGCPLSCISPIRVTTQTTTAGATLALSPTVANELRFNFSRVDANAQTTLDNFGGATPLGTLPLPGTNTDDNSLFIFHIFSLSAGALQQGFSVANSQRQINVTDNLSIQKGPHRLKLGIDFRRLTPVFQPQSYLQDVAFSDVPSAAMGDLYFDYIATAQRVPLLFKNLGAFAQDTWQARPGLTLAYGLRWDVDFDPSTISGPGLPAAINFNNPAALALAPSGTPAFKTRYGNLAPRLGVAYELSQSQQWQRVLRIGMGIFFDLATTEVGNNFNYSYPFGASRFDCCFSGTFPLDPTTAAAPPISPASLSDGTLFSFDPHLRLPYSGQWNVALEQALGKEQTFTASYIGSVGRRLIQSATILSPNQNIDSAVLLSNWATSDYSALQMQFQRRLTRGLQVLASHTWAHSMDTASASSYGLGSNTSASLTDPQLSRGPSDFDIRHTFSAAFTYQLPGPKTSAIGNAILGGWSLNSVIQARSAPPVDVYNSSFVLAGGFLANVRPDLAPGVPLYLNGSQYPGGRILNNTPDQGGVGCTGAFCPPPLDAGGTPLREGDLGRNALRGFGATQWDLAIHRVFTIHDSLKLQLRAEMFNILNHPNFAPPVSDLSDPQFGQSIQTLGASLNGGTLGGNVGGGAFSPLYQLGGPRSIQMVLKLEF
jgi:Carboxypeptidase regulatory-like domain